MTVTPAPAVSGSTTGPGSRSGVVHLVFLIVVGVIIGGLTGSSAPRYEADATVVLIGLEAPGREDLNPVGRYVLDRLETWAAVAESDLVADAAATRAGRPPGALRGSITAEGRKTRSYLELTVTAPTAELAVRGAEAAAGATADTITALESVRR